jgi:hypothetical protein
LNAFAFVVVAAARHGPQISRARPHVAIQHFGVAFESRRRRGSRRPHSP